MAGRKKIEEPVKETKKKATTKAATKAAPKKAPRKTVVDTVAVEVPVEEEPKIEVEKVNPVEEIFNQLTGRYNNLGDTEKAIASKVFENTKNEMKDSFSEENALVIAAAATDAALFSMNNIMRSIEKQKKMEAIKKEREENKKQRMQLRDERRQTRINKRQTREQRRAALGITQ